MPSKAEKWAIVERYNSRHRRAVPGQPFPPPMTYEEVMAELLQEYFTSTGDFKPGASMATPAPIDRFEYQPPIEQVFDSTPEPIEQMFDDYKPPFVKSADLILAALKKGASLEEALDSMETHYKETRDGM